MNNKVVFNYMPPAMLTMPSAAMSILKQFLLSKDYNVEIFYWNLKISDLQCKFLWTENLNSLDDESNSMMLFFNYLAIRSNDKKSYNTIKAKLMAIKPHYIGQDIGHFDKHMTYYAQKLDDLIDEVILEICSPDVLWYGMTYNLYQWVCSSIIALKIKEKYPNSVIVVGGIGTKDTAVKLLENFDQFDFALWGESENSIVNLSNELKHSKSNFEIITNLAFRQNNIIKTSKNKRVDYINLSHDSIKPDYSDYFYQKIKYPHLNKIKPTINLETSRGCHWMRCHFCYLNIGYKYRIKPIKSIIDEILFFIREYDMYIFNFLDNDIIGQDFERYNLLLDELIKIKELYPEFTIDLAEIITVGVDADILKKMTLAGFTRIQIGYESPSNSLLKKINKKNTFASNLHLIKFANLFQISISGANIIMGLLEETDEDIMEAIENLHYMRFVLKGGNFRHSITGLAIMHSSPYYSKIKDDKSNWHKGGMFSLYMPSGYLKAGDENADIVDLHRLSYNSLWNEFRQIENYYLANKCEYKLLKKSESVLYREYLNKIIVNELEFEISSLDWFILQTTNDSVLKLNDLLDLIKTDFNADILDVEVINTLEELKSEKLIYLPNDYSEITSIINTNLVL